MHLDHHFRANLHSFISAPRALIFIPQRNCHRPTTLRPKHWKRIDQMCPSCWLYLWSRSNGCEWIWGWKVIKCSSKCRITWDVEYVCHPDQMVVSKCGGVKCMNDNLGGESHRNIRQGQVSASGLKCKCIWSWVGSTTSNPTLILDHWSKAFRLRTLTFDIQHSTFVP